MSLYDPGEHARRAPLDGLEARRAREAAAERAQARMLELVEALLAEQRTTNELLRRLAVERI